MTSSSYFDKMNSTLGSVVPLAMFQQGMGEHLESLTFFQGLCDIIHFEGLSHARITNISHPHIKESHQLSHMETVCTSRYIAPVIRASRAPCFDRVALLAIK